MASIAVLGPTPVPKAIAECEQVLEHGLSDRQIEASVLCMLARLRAMHGDIVIARELYRRGRAMLRELGQGVRVAATGMHVALVELRGGDLSLAEREVRADYDMLSSMGEKYHRSAIAALLARLLRDQGRDSEALGLLEVAQELSAPHDMESQALWRSVKASIVARSGDTGAADRLAREAVELVRDMEAPGLQGDALAELAEVLQIAGRVGDAGVANDEAIALYDAKGDTVAARARRAWAATSG
jgi:tetratricopeptide (TPR) repeat protein